VTKRFFWKKRGYEEPALEEFLHRPPGSPQPREKSSQKCQLQSRHRHGTSKNIKLGMVYKTGLRDLKAPRHSD